MVYHGPSGGCKACRIRRRKCDQSKPVCNNCVQRRQICPGYGDVFDGAHRSQNQIVRCRIERQNAAKDAKDSGLGGGTPSHESPMRLLPTTSSCLPVVRRTQTTQQWRAYSTDAYQSRSTLDRSKSSADVSPPSVVDIDLDAFTYRIPSALKQNSQETSLCFFFRHYSGTAFDPDAHDGFNQLWQPMYKQVPAESPLRLATAAVAVNIAMMWCFRGCDARPARSLFTKAIAAAREAMHDPFQNTTDELLMTILVFDLYDALILHYVPGALDYGKHKHGALAMIEHRGWANLATIRGRALIRTVRHSLLHYMLSSRTAFPEGADDLFHHPSMNDTKASTFDLISIQLSRVQSRLWTLRLESRLARSLEERRACYQEIIAEAIRLETFFLDWKASITDPEWLPEYVPRSSVTQSIQDAGFYGSRCSVWMNLMFGGIWILFSIRYLLTLQVIRQSFADDVSLLNNPEHRALISKVNVRVQKLVDFICDIVPFYLGDSIIPTNPIYSASINFPYSFKTNLKTGISTRIPSLRSNHQQRATAAGGWIIFPHLVNVYRLAEPEDNAIPISLREGQLDWIKGQVKRLQKIYLFCEPVWFKRSTPSSAKGDMP